MITTPMNDTIKNQIFLPEVSISISEPESGTMEVFHIRSYNDLYQVNSLLDSLLDLSTHQASDLSTFSFGITEFDELVREFYGRDLVLSFPNDTENSIMLPLSLFLEAGLDLRMFLEDSRHIINEAFKRSIINSNIILRFNKVDGTYFYLKVSSLMGNLDLETKETGESYFSFQTNLKYPDTFDFSQVTSISNIDMTRFEPFFLTDVQLLAEPELLLGADKVYRFLFKGFLQKVVEG